MFFSIITGETWPCVVHHRVEGVGGVEGYVVVLEVHQVDEGLNVELFGSGFEVLVESLELALEELADDICDVHLGLVDDIAVVNLNISQFHLLLHLLFCISSKIIIQHTYG